LGGPSGPKKGVKKEFREGRRGGATDTGPRGDTVVREKKKKNQTKNKKRA